MFESKNERPCTCCGKMTHNKEYVMIHAGKSRPLLVAKCQGECETEVRKRESQLLSQLIGNQYASLYTVRV